MMKCDEFMINLEARLYRNWQPLANHSYFIHQEQRESTTIRQSIAKAPNVEVLFTGMSHMQTVIRIEFTHGVK